MMDVQHSDAVTDVELASMEHRCRSASPGPWTSYVVGRDLEAGLNCIELGSYRLVEVVGATVEDQDFIAHAREDLPRLISEVRLLRSLLEMGTDASAIGAAHRMDLTDAHRGGAVR